MPQLQPTFAKPKLQEIPTYGGPIIFSERFGKKRFWACFTGLMIFGVFLLTSRSGAVLDFFSLW
jgi:hypothetical protein